MNMAMAEKVDQINTILGEHKDGFYVSFKEVPRSTGIRNAYLIHEPNSETCATPIIYEDDIKTMSTTEIVSYIENVYQNNRLEIGMELGDIASPDFILKHITPHIGPSNREQYLRKADYIVLPFLDMTVTLAVTLKGKGFYLLSEKMLEKSRIRYDQLMDAAFHNLESDYTIRTMSETLAAMGCGSIDEEEDLPLYVVTNATDGQYGAGVILSHKILSEVSDRMKSNKVIIFPSSVHEIICVPENFADDIHGLQRMVADINAEVVSDEDQLSDSVYIWDNAQKTLNIAE